MINKELNEIKLFDRSSQDKNEVLTIQSTHNAFKGIRVLPHI